MGPSTKLDADQRLLGHHAGVLRGGREAASPSPYSQSSAVLLPFSAKMHTPSVAIEPPPLTRFFLAVVPNDGMVSFSAQVGGREVVGVEVDRVAALERVDHAVDDHGVGPVLGLLGLGGLVVDERHARQHRAPGQRVEAVGVHLHGTSPCGRRASGSARRRPARSPCRTWPSRRWAPRPGSARSRRPRCSGRTRTCSP